MKKTKNDNILAIVKAAISVAPYFGDPIASLIGDYIPSATKKEVGTITNTEV